ncbi:hypothetical protein JCM16408A_49050 [Methylobacterium phyllosphaerae]
MTAPATINIVQDIPILEPSLTKERLSLPHAAIGLAPSVGADTDPEHTSCEPLNGELDGGAITAPAAGKVVQDIRTLDPTLSEMRLSLPHAAIGLAPSVGADTDPEPASCEPLNGELDGGAITAPAAGKVVQDIRTLDPTLSEMRLSLPHAAIGLAPRVGADTDPEPASCEPLNGELDGGAITAPAAGKVVQDIRTLDPTLSEMRLSLPHAAIGLEPSVGADTDPEPASCEPLNGELDGGAITAPAAGKVVQDIRTLDPTLSEMRLSLPHAAIGLEPSVGADTDPEPASCEPLNGELEEAAITAPAAGKVVQDIRTLDPTLSEMRLSLPHAAIGLEPSVGADPDLKPSSCEALNRKLEDIAVTEPAAVKVAGRRKPSRDGNRRPEASVPFSEWTRDLQRTHVQDLIDRLPNSGWYARCSERGCEARAAFICADEGHTFCRPHRRYAYEAVALAAFGLGPEDWAGRPECDGDFRGW